MRTIALESVASAVEALCVRCAFELPADVLAALKAAMETERDARAKRILEQLLENARIASSERIPLCQDTGLAIVFVELGAGVQMTPPAEVLKQDASTTMRESNTGETPVPLVTLIDAINAGVAAGYEKGYLRKSVVAEPLQERPNTKTNTPAIVHVSIAAGEGLKLSLMAKGGGCENKSQFRMFNPTEQARTVADWIVEVVRQAGPNACPPYVVGIGMGGNFEVSALLSKKALLRPMGQWHQDAFYAAMEKDLLAAINATGIGPQGFGGDTTALEVAIETAPCHIASLPVAVTIECHSHRHASVIL